MKYFHAYLLIFTSLILGCEENKSESPVNGSQLEIESVDTLKYNEEIHLKNLHQLTYGGDNAEAYWSFDSKKLIFQANNPSWGVSCDQIFWLNVSKDGKEENVGLNRVSNGLGRTTCAYFMPGDSTVVFASTHLGDSLCPEVPPRGPNGEYVWPIYEDYDIFIYDLTGNPIQQLTNEAGYDAEATVSPTGDRMVFTSMRSGDLELFTCDLDGGNVVQITNELGYDGGAFFSPDGSQLIWRASRPVEEQEVAHYKDLLSKGLVEPTSMELFIANADGTEQRQLTNLGGANWAPFFHPNGKSVLFSSNHRTKSFPFNIFRIQINGDSLEQITFDEAFDSFPMFSPDGKKIAFSSNRNNGRTRSTNVFVADWVD